MLACLVTTWPCFFIVRVHAAIVVGFGLGGETEPLVVPEAAPGAGAARVDVVGAHSYKELLGWCAECRFWGFWGW